MSPKRDCGSKKVKLESESDDKKEKMKLTWQRRASVVGGAQGNGREGGQQEEWEETRPRACGEGGQQEYKGNRGGRIYISGSFN